MKKFMDEDFLLGNEPARRLFHDYAKKMPIFDYHCHLQPQQIADDVRFENMTRIWLGGDHYKWRLMRTNGVHERFITGDAPDREKFTKWAETVPHTIGNPLYHWTHMELKNPFGFTDLVFGPDTAEDVWVKCNDLLAKPGFSARGLMERFNVKVVCTTDDPADDLSYHKKIREDGSFRIRVLPTFRPDKAHAVEEPAVFISYLEKLGQAAGIEIDSYRTLIEALEKRVEYFHDAGCRLSDHALLTSVCQDASESELEASFKKLSSGKLLNPTETAAFHTAVLLELGRMYAARGWAMQLHIAALRNNNFRMMQKLGPDTGFDSIADYPIAYHLSRFLDRLDETGELPKTILYSLNPNDNAALATMIGNFQDGSVPGKMQHGSAWWFNDHRDGMEDQMRQLANVGLLSRFIGMLTDSRSFLSYPRHEYFRRVLCNLVGSWVENGKAPADYALLGSMIENICFNNAKNYFGIEIP